MCLQQDPVMINNCYLKAASNQLSLHILMFSLSVEPTIVMPEMVSARAGAKLRVEALVSGKPAPICKWMRGEDAVVPSSRLAVHQSGNLCVLIIKDVSRTDSGEYSLVAENSSAKVVQALKIVIRGQYDSENKTIRVKEIQYYFKTD